MSPKQDVYRVGGESQSSKTFRNWVNENRWLAFALGTLIVVSVVLIVLVSVAFSRRQPSTTPSSLERMNQLSQEVKAGQTNNDGIEKQVETLGRSFHETQTVLTELQQTLVTQQSAIEQQSQQADYMAQALNEMRGQSKRLSKSAVSQQVSPGQLNYLRDEHMGATIQVVSTGLVINNPPILCLPHHTDPSIIWAPTIIQNRGEQGELVLTTYQHRRSNNDFSPIQPAIFITNGVNGIPRADRSRFLVMSGELTTIRLTPITLTQGPIGWGLEADLDRGTSTVTITDESPSFLWVVEHIAGGYSAPLADPSDEPRYQRYQLDGIPGDKPPMRQQWESATYMRLVSSVPSPVRAYAGDLSRLHWLMAMYSRK